MREKWGKHRVETQKCQKEKILLSFKAKQRRDIMNEWEREAVRKVYGDHIMLKNNISRFFSHPFLHPAVPDTWAHTCTHRYTQWLYFATACQTFANAVEPNDTFFCVLLWIFIAVSHLKWSGLDCVVGIFWWICCCLDVFHRLTLRDDTDIKKMFE